MLIPELEPAFWDLQKTRDWAVVEQARHQALARATARGERKQQVQEHAQALQWLVDCEGNSLSDAALRFCLSHPAVSTVIAGMRRPGHVRANVEAADRGALSAESQERLQEHAWPHNFWI